MSNFKKDVKDFYDKNKETVITVGVLSGMSIAASLVAGIIGHVSVKLIDKVIKQEDEVMMDELLIIVLAIIAYKALINKK